MKKIKLTKEERKALKKKTGIIAEFKKFINKGNVVDMAVGVVIATAFSKITSSLVNDIIMPLISLATGNVSLVDRKWILVPEVLDEAGAVVTKAVSVNYGQFLQYVLDFLLVAICIFLAMKIVSSFRTKIEKIALEEKRKKGLIEEAPAPAPTTKKCPYCLTDIAIGATRCPNCTSQLEDK